MLHVIPSLLRHPLLPGKHNTKARNPRFLAAPGATRWTT